MRISTIIARALIPAALFLAAACPAARAQFNGGSWRPAAGPDGGKITALVAAADGSIIAGTPSGIYRSTNNGANWSLRSGDVPFLPVNGLARDSAGLLYAATSPGVYRSTDNGMSWIRRDPENYAMTSISIYDRTGVIASRAQALRRWRPELSAWNTYTYRSLNATTVITALAAQNGVIYLGTSDDGLYRSDDGGTTIQKVEGLPCNAIHSIDIRTINSGEIALAVGTSCGLFRWTTIDPIWTEFPGPLSGRPVTAVKQIGNALYAGTKGFGIFRTYDGVNWTEVYNGMENNSINAIEGAPSGTIFCGTLHGVQRSENQGERWDAVSTGIRATVIRSMVINSKGYLFACTETGVYRSVDKGATWQEKNYLLTDRDVRCLALDPQGNLWAGTGGNRLFHSSDDGDSWEERKFAPYSPAESMIESILFLPDGRMVVGTSGSLGKLYISTGAETSWRVPFEADVMAIARGGNTIYVLTSDNGLYRSTNAGDMWSLVRNVPGYTALAVNAAGSVLLGGAKDVAVSKTSGDTWNTWTPAPCGPYRGVMLDADGNMIVGPGCGPFRSTDRGGTWVPYREGLNAPITAFAQYPDRTLVAGTDGAGIYLRENIPSSTPTDTDGNGSNSSFLISGLLVHPNPVSGRATVRYSSDRSLSVTMTISDALGRIVSRPAVDAVQEAGEHEIMLETEGLAAGVYLCSVNAGGVERSVRFVVVR